jgi:hypothetical protein
MKETHHIISNFKIINKELLLRNMMVFFMKVVMVT